MSDAVAETSMFERIGGPVVVDRLGEAAKANPAKPPRAGFGHPPL